MIVNEKSSLSLFCDAREICEPRDISTTLSYHNNGAWVEYENSGAQNTPMPGREENAYIYVREHGESVNATWMDVPKMHRSGFSYLFFFLFLRLSIHPARESTVP